MKTRLFLNIFFFLFLIGCEKTDNAPTSQTKTEVKLNGTWDKVQTVVKTYQKGTNALIGTQTTNFDTGDYEMYDGNKIIEFLDRKMVNTFTYEIENATRYKQLLNGQLLYTVTVKELTANRLLTYHEKVNAAGDLETTESTRTR